MKNMSAIMQPAELIQAQQHIRSIHVSSALVDYVQAIAHKTREGGIFAEGMSPRAAIALLQAARACAALEGRDHVIPEDVQAVSFTPLKSHAYAHQC
jgi:MoxR-like ATPase